MADNFNMKQFLMENKLGAYSRIKENSLTEARKPDFIIPANDAYDLDEEAENFENILNNADIMAKCKAGIGEVEVYLTDKTDLAQAKQVLEDEGYQVGYNEIDEAKEKSNKQKLIDAGYSESDAEDFADEFEQGGVKVPQKVKDILTGKGKMVKKGITEGRGWDFLVYDMNPVLAGKLIGSAKKLGVSVKVDEYNPAEWEVRIHPNNEKTFKIVFKILKKMGLEFEESHGMFEEGKKESLNERDNPVYVWEGSKCYRLDDEGNKDEVNISYCRMYAEGKEKEEEQFAGINEAGMFATKANINPELVDKIERFVKGVAKTYEYSIDDAYTNIMSVLKSGLSKKEESLNEMLEPHVYERMYNLSNIKAQQAMIKAAEILMNDLTAEGFEVPEIREFFTQLISNDI